MSAGSSRPLLSRASENSDDIHPVIGIHRTLQQWVIQNSATPPGTLWQAIPAKIFDTTITQSFLWPTKNKNKIKKLLETNAEKDFPWTKLARSPSFFFADKQQGHHRQQTTKCCQKGRRVIIMRYVIPLLPALIYYLKAKKLDLDLHQSALVTRSAIS